MAVVEAEFCFLEMEIESPSWDSLELREAVFGITPKGLNAIDVIVQVGEFVVAMTNLTKDP